MSATIVLSLKLAEPTVIVAFLPPPDEPHAPATSAAQRIVAPTATARLNRMGGCPFCWWRRGASHGFGSRRRAGEHLILTSVGRPASHAGRHERPLEERQAEFGQQ